MKIYACIIALLSAISSSSAFTIIWDAPADYSPDAYVIWHGTTSGQYSEFYNAGSETNFVWYNSIPNGLNYFTVSAFHLDDGYNLQMSALSSEIVVTNDFQVILTQVLLTSTNVNNGWQPMSTNSVQFSPSLPQQFFKSSLAISGTNVISVAAPK